jgi:hypothetical protein
MKLGKAKVGIMENLKLYRRAILLMAMKRDDGTFYFPIFDAERKETTLLSGFVTGLFSVTFEKLLSDVAKKSQQGVSSTLVDWWKGRGPQQSQEFLDWWKRNIGE